MMDHPDHSTAFACHLLKHAQAEKQIDTHKTASAAVAVKWISFPLLSIQCAHKLRSLFLYMSL